MTSLIRDCQRRILVYTARHIMIIYNLFPLLAGPFSQWDSHFTRAAKMGFDWVFVNPIQYPGFSGSLYSIKDYLLFHPLLLDSASAASAEDQVRQMTNTGHQRGLKLMIDLVLNHCAIDSPLIREHPEWFVREPDGKVAHPFAMHGQEKVVWGDLARFDHEHTRDPEGLYRHCLEIVNHFLSLGFEGFRCDAAYQVPHRVWHRLIHEIKARHPQTIFTAETLGCTADETKNTARAGFDYIFNSAKWWNYYDSWLIEQYNLTRETTPSICFPESHDTERLAAELNSNVAGLKQRYLFTALFSAGVMMPLGFEFGFRKPLHVVKTRPSDWETTNIDLTGYIAAVNAIKHAHHVFQEDAPLTFLPYQNPNILLMWKASVRHRDEALLILNKDIHQHQEFTTDNFRHFIQSGAALQDVSPEFPLDYLPEPFHYALRPGQGIVLVTRRK